MVSYFVIVFIALITHFGANVFNFFFVRPTADQRTRVCTEKNRSRNR